MKNDKSAGTPASQVLWAGRLEEKPGAEAFAFQASLGVDRRLAAEDIAGSRAHAAMLGKQGIIGADTAAALETELARLAERFPFEPGAPGSNESGGPASNSPATDGVPAADKPGGSGAAGGLPGFWLGALALLGLEAAVVLLWWLARG